MQCLTVNPFATEAPSSEFFGCILIATQSAQLLEMKAAFILQLLVVLWTSACCSEKGATKFRRVSGEKIGPLPKLVTQRHSAVTVPLSVILSDAQSGTDIGLARPFWHFLVPRPCFSSSCLGTGMDALPGTL